MDDFPVVVTAGTLRDQGEGVVHLPHRWTEGGVGVRTAFTGAHLLHLAAAGCVLNDVYREALRLGVAVDGVRVTAWGGFDAGAGRSAGITYAVDLDSPAPVDRHAALLAVVDEVAEIPRAVRAGAPVSRAQERDERDER